VRLFFKIYSSITQQVVSTRHMHAISDGERRRVQICMGLMKPWDVLLLDEVRKLAIKPPIFNKE
jgi:ABC-type uncharacterized transport system ATPase subunit